MCASGRPCQMGLRYDAELYQQQLGINPALGIAVAILHCFKLFAAQRTRFGVVLLEVSCRQSIQTASSGEAPSMA